MAGGSNRTSRADEVRARRQIEPVKRKPIPNNPSVRVTRDAQNASRVVARRSHTSSSYSRHAASRSRSRVYMPTGTPGSELRLPALPQLRLTWRVLSGIIAIAMLGILYLMSASDAFAVSQVNLTGGIRVPADEISQKLNLTGENLINLIPSEIETRILEHFSDIKSAEVSISMPNEINIVVQERIPALLWLIDEEIAYWIDQDGFAFDVRGEATLPIRVYANGEPPHPIGWAQTEVIAASEAGQPAKETPLVDPAFILAVQKLNGIKPAESQMLYLEKYGLGWVDPHGWRVYFGKSAKDIDMKLLEYASIVDAILERNLQPHLISLEFLHAPYYRLEP